MPGKPSRDKGTRGEQAVAKAYQARGITARRVPNSGGLDTKGDLVGVPGVHVEVKNTEALNIWKAMKQAEREAPAGDIPAVHFRRNRSPWYVCVPLDDFIDLHERSQPGFRPKAVVPKERTS